jgi:hypothetical protein
VTYDTTFINKHSVEILDLNDLEMPLFSVDKLAKNGLPQKSLRRFAAPGLFS